MEGHPEFTSTEDAQEWRDWVDWEGGLIGLLGHGGSLDFPPSLRSAAHLLDQAHEYLREETERVLKEWGVTW